MRRNQWFVFAVVFLLMAIFFQYLGNISYSHWTEITAESLKEKLKALEENTWTEQFGIMQLSKESFAGNSFIAANTSLNFSNMFWGIFVACVICCFMEPKRKKK